MLLLGASQVSGADDWSQDERPSKVALTVISGLWGPAFQWQRNVSSSVDDESFTVGNDEVTDKSWRASLGISLVRKWPAGYGLRLAYQFYSKSEFSDDVRWSGDGASGSITSIRAVPEYSVHAFQLVGKKNLGSVGESLRWYLGVGLSAFVLHMHDDSKIVPPAPAGFDYSGDTLTVQWANSTSIGLTGFPLIGMEGDLQKELAFFVELQMHFGRTFTDTDSDSYTFAGGNALVDRESYFRVISPAVVAGIMVDL